MKYTGKMEVPYFIDFAVCVLKLALYMPFPERKIIMGYQTTAALHSSSKIAAANVWNNTIE